MGSVHYISPEQAKNGYIDEKSDIYSLGITLYEMITGKVPFEGDSTVSVALQHINEELPNPKLLVKDLPVSVEMIIEKCTQKKPERRYLKVSSLIADLKKSLISPDEDFVQMIPLVADGKTVVLTKNDVSLLNESDKSNRDIDSEENENSLVSDDDDIFNEDDDIDAVNPKMDKLITIGGFAIGIIVIILILLIATSSFGNCGSDESEKETKKTEESSSLSDKQTYVPDVVGKTEEEAESILNKASLGFKVGKREASNTVPKGSVIKQSKEAGSVVDKNSKIEVTISEGPKEVTVPDVLKKTKDEATELLEGKDYGLVVSYQYEINKDIEADHVIKTTPEADTKVKYGDPITLIISQGADTSDVAVPKLTGLTGAEAQASLLELNLTIKVIKEEYSDKVETGKIISQDFPEGKVVPRGTEVGVVVSKGVKPTEATTAKETTTVAVVSSMKKVTFPSVKYNELTLPKALNNTGVEVTPTGTISIKLSYTTKSGDTAYANITPDNAALTADTSWSQGQINIEKEAKPGSEAIIEFTLEYNTYKDNNGTFELKKETAIVKTIKAVFNN